MAEVKVEPKIVLNPSTMLGKPVIAGTRITVELILEKMSYGMSVEELLKSYPRLTRESIHAAFAYAAEVVHSQFDVSKSTLAQNSKEPVA